MNKVSSFPCHIAKIDVVLPRSESVQRYLSTSGSQLMKKPGGKRTGNKSVGKKASSDIQGKGQAYSKWYKVFDLQIQLR